MDKIIFAAKVVGFVLGFLIVSSFLYPRLAKADELWITSGMWSRHNNEDYYHYKQNNSGIGLSYKHNDYDFVVGEYDNSIRKHSNYLGMIDTPLKCGQFRFGVFAGAVSGYTRNVKYFPVAAPVMVYEYHGIGVNFIWVPSVVASVQLKIKVW